jgi:hypothetical protein
MKLIGQRAGAAAAQAVTHAAAILRSVTKRQIGVGLTIASMVCVNGFKESSAPIDVCWFVMGSITFFGAVWCLATIRPWSKRAAAIALIVLASILWGKNGVSLSHHHTDDGWTVGTTYSRFNAIPLRQSFIRLEPFGFSGGPLSESGKKHGHWTAIGMRNEIEQLPSNRWFWYGEEITEGEWHLRNK